MNSALVDGVCVSTAAVKARIIEKPCALRLDSVKCKTETMADKQPKVTPLFPVCLFIIYLFIIQIDGFQY